MPHASKCHVTKDDSVGLLITEVVGGSYCYRIAIKSLTLGCLSSSGLSSERAALLGGIMNERDPMPHPVP
jgi:hypothetical protein